VHIADLSISIPAPTSGHLEGALIPPTELSILWPKHDWQVIIQAVAPRRSEPCLKKTTASIDFYRCFVFEIPTYRTVGRRRFDRRPNLQALVLLRERQRVFLLNLSEDKLFALVLFSDNRGAKVFGGFCPFTRAQALPTNNLLRNVPV
jgi:hypothetical protein